MREAEERPEPEHEAEAPEDVLTESHPGGRLQQRRGDIGAVTLEYGANLGIQRESITTNKTIVFSIGCQALRI